MIKICWGADQLSQMKDNSNYTPVLLLGGSTLQITVSCLGKFRFYDWPPILYHSYYTLIGYTHTKNSPEVVFKYSI